jgi:pimeloyl-ACP methyl ester carboxylesterase
MKPSSSHFHDIRKLRYHVRTWGDSGKPVLVMLHGWMDVSASFQFLVDALRQDWYVVAPDWRGFGLTDWSPEPYWFPDYYSDLDAILQIYSPQAPVRMVAHSMGGNIACTYAGIRPERIARLVSLEGFGYLRMAPKLAPDRYARWLNELREQPRLKPYKSIAQVAERMHDRNPHLSAERALFLAEHWARSTPSGEYILRADPKHKMSNPVLNRIEEHVACWQRITAPVFWVWGRETRTTSSKQDTPEQWNERKSAFRDLREITIDEAGHMIHLDQPERLALAIEPFLHDA